MVAAGSHPKELHIQHMGKPGQWYPVALIKRGESPDRSVQGQALFDMEVASDVDIIIIVEEGMAPHLCIDHEGQGGDAQADQDYLPISFGYGEGHMLCFAEG